jgi:hypothetical protein
MPRILRYHVRQGKKTHTFKMNYSVGNMGWGNEWKEVSGRLEF